ncbi:MAG: OsmC family protein [Lewinellaceae bacterium]|nr:OsmC family protein [Saprospiraceae bacterium]MCB9339102.1 OsmC family protein [Lewinellaceae bacterium]
MQITLKRLNNDVLFQCTNEDGNTTLTEGSPDIGGTGQGIRPMQLLLMSLASCSGIDVVMILKKLRQPLEDIQVEVNGERDTENVPPVFKKIHLHFILQGDLNEEKVAKAIGLSVDKYCSVARMLEKTAAISWDFELILPK